MEWSDFNIFLHVTRQGTIAAATSSLGLDHATISRRINRLERGAGVRLVERIGRRLTITEQGRRLAAVAAEVESIILRDVLTLAEDASAISGRVRIGAPEEFAVHYLAPRFGDIGGEHEHLELELVVQPRPPSLAAREVDLLITTERPRAGDLRVKKLTSFSLGLYGVSAYFGDRPRPMTKESLRQEVWCGYAEELKATSEVDASPDPRRTLSAKYRTSSVSAQLAAALSGASLAALPCFVARAHSELERLDPVQFTFVRDYWLAVHADLANSPRIRAVIDAIERNVRRDRWLFHDCRGGEQTDKVRLAPGVVAERPARSQSRLTSASP